MTTRSVLFAAVAISGVFASSVSYAGPDFSGSNNNMGFLSIGNSGTITNIYQGLYSIPPNEVASSINYGYIPRNSQINFTYHLTSGIIGGATSATSNYNYVNNGNQYNGSSVNVSGQAPIQGGFVNGVAGVSQVFASAYYTPGQNLSATGSTRISNYTQRTLENPLGYQYFSSTLFAVLLSNPQATGYITYAVTSLPLPAALPMLATAVAGLFGFARKQRKVVAA